MPKKIFEAYKMWTVRNMECIIWKDDKNIKNVLEL